MVQEGFKGSFKGLPNHEGLGCEIPRKEEEIFRIKELEEDNDIRTIKIKERRIFYYFESEKDSKEKLKKNKRSFFRTTHQFR